MEKVESEIGKNAQFGKHMIQSEMSSKKEKKEEGAMAKINKDSVKLGIEVLNNVIAEVVKDTLFNAKLQQ